MSESGGAAPPRPTTTLDLAVVVALLVLALLGLGNTFSGWDYLGLGTVATALGILLALMTLRMHPAVLVAAVPIVGIGLGGPLALGISHLGGGVVETVGAVMKGAVTGWSEYLTTLPYVDLSGPPAMVPFLLGFAGGAVATALALRTRSSALPVLPLLGVLAVVLLLRRPGQEPVGWYQLGFALVALGWVVVRGLAYSPDHTVPVRGSANGRLGRAVTALVVVLGAVALALTVTSGQSPSEGATLRGQRAAAVDFSSLDSPLRRFRSFTDQPGGYDVHDKLLFSVSGVPAGTRVRLLTLDRYNGREWLPGNDTVRGVQDDGFLHVDSTMANDATGRRVRAQVTVAAYRSAWLPTAGSLTSLRFLLGADQQRLSGLLYDMATSTALLPSGLRGGDDYEFTSVLPEDRLTPRMQPWPRPTQHVRGLHKVDPFVRRLVPRPAPPIPALFHIADYLRTEGRYSNGGSHESQYLPGNDLTRLTRGFLLAPRPVGDDEQYAAAVALVANRLGIPARVVVGAVLPPKGQVRGKDVHAWVEVRVADGTWRTLPTRAFMGTRPPRPHEGAVVLPPPAAPKAGVPPPSDLTPRDRPAQQPARQDAARQRNLLRSAPWLLLLLLAAALPAVKMARRALRRRRGRPSDRIARGWVELLDHARDLGVPVPLDATRPAQALVLGCAADLADRADREVFGPSEPEDSAVRAFWGDVDAAAKELDGRHPWWRRAWAFFSVRTLLRPVRPRRVTGAPAEPQRELVSAGR